MGRRINRRHATRTSSHSREKRGDIPLVRPKAQALGGNLVISAGGICVRYELANDTRLGLGYLEYLRLKVTANYLFPAAHFT